MPRFAARVARVQQSATARAIDTAYRLRSSGVSVVTFQNRLPVPPSAADAARQGLEEAWSSFYTEARGLRKLRGAVAATSALAASRAIDPDSEVLVSVGARGAMFAFFLATLDPADEVLLPEPTWGGYAPGLAAAGANVIPVGLHCGPDGFSLDPDALRSACTERTKLIVLNSPHNPTGMVLSKGTLAAIADLAKEKDFFVLSDECYENFVYDGARHISIASMPGMFERTLTVSSVSKTFNMFGAGGSDGRSARPN